MVDMVLYFSILAFIGMILWFIVFRNQQSRIIVNILKRLDELEKLCGENEIKNASEKKVSERDEQKDIQKKESGKFLSKGEAICRNYLETRFDREFPNIRPDWLRNPLTNRKLELDCYNEDLKLAVEYNGIQHYIYPNKYHKTRKDFDAQVLRDMHKERICKEQGIVLISVPYSIPFVDIESFLEKSLDEEFH